MKIPRILHRASLRAVSPFWRPPWLAVLPRVLYQAIPDAIDAYIYGYPLVTMEMTRRVMTNVAAPNGTRCRWGNLSACAPIRRQASAM